MGAGILPVSMHNGKLYFLFGKENKYADTPGWSDFGGGTDNYEDHLETAIREAREELTGFLGDDKMIRTLILKNGRVEIVNKTNGHSAYHMFVVPMDYDKSLVNYYNNNQRFLQEKLPQTLIKQSKIFEKEEINWVCITDFDKMMGKFRPYFKEIAKKVVNRKKDILQLFAKKAVTHRNTRKMR